jgi:hypothetical protein
LPRPFSCFFTWMSASRVTPKTPSSRLSQTPAVPNVLLTYQPSLTSLPCASFATRATTSSRIAGSTLTNLAKPSPQRAGVRPLPELPNASPRTPGPDASSTLSPGSQAAPWPDQSWAFPCLFPLAVLACFHVALAHSASVLTASLNAVGNRLCVRRVQVEGTPTVRPWWRQTGTPHQPGSSLRTRVTAGGAHSSQGRSRGRAAPRSARRWMRRGSTRCRPCAPKTTTYRPHPR